MIGRRPAGYVLTCSKRKRALLYTVDFGGRHASFAFMTVVHASTVTYLFSHSVNDLLSVKKEIVRHLLLVDASYLLLARLRAQQRALSPSSSLGSDQHKQRSTKSWKQCV